MHGLLIDSFKRQVRPIALSLEVKNFQEQVRTGLSCEIPIYTANANGTLFLIADENCLLENNFAVKIYLMPRPLFGNIILVGRNPENGHIEDLPDDVDIFSLGLSIQYYSKEQTEIIRKETLAYVRSLNEK